MGTLGIGKGDEDFSKPIKNILEQNDDIKPQKYIITLLNFLENIIPENVRKNFYRNLRTLLIELNFDYDFSNVDENTNEIRGKCKLKPYKSYFAFEIRDSRDDV